MRVLVAPDSFKGSATATEVAAALARGWRERRSGDDVVELPMADGGEGTLDALRAGQPGATAFPVRVTGPDGRPVTAEWLLLEDGTAVVELARSSGLPLMRRPDALGAGTRGLGEVVAAALDVPAVRRLLVTVGGSASTDGGTGALAALGARFLDAAGQPLPPGGGALSRLDAVDLSGVRPPPAEGVRCLVDVTSPLLGPHGAAAVFGPQKGADADQVRHLDSALARLAQLLGGSPDAPGAGAAGGTAYGLATVWGALLVPGAEAVADAAGLPGRLLDADVVITGEGRFDEQSLRGKVVGHVASLATERSLPVLLSAGQVSGSLPPGIRRAVALADLAGGAEEAQREAVRWLEEAGRQLAGAWAPDGVG